MRLRQLEGLVALALGVGEQLVEVGVDLSCPGRSARSGPLVRGGKLSLPLRVRGVAGRGAALPVVGSVGQAGCRSCPYLALLGLVVDDLCVDDLLLGLRRGAVTRRRPIQRRRPGSWADW